MDYHDKLFTLTRVSVVVLFCGACIFSPGSEGVLPTDPTPEGPEPQFADVIPNVTVVAGRTVRLPCVVDGLGNYKIAWTHTDRRTLLSLNDRVIIRDSRYKIFHNNFRTWWLQIQDVNESDSGHYMCEINTTPPKNLVGIIRVVVPPKILADQTSSDTDVREGTDVSLRCKASGSPPPIIKWRTEVVNDIALRRMKGLSVEGEYLNITNTRRMHMDTYLCIAVNGVQPTASKRIMLNVNFAPMIWIPNQLVGAAIGSDVTLVCNVELHPKSVMYWTRDGGGVVILSNPNNGSIFINRGLYKVQMSLRVKSLRPEDFGSYTCVAKNSLGETEGTIRLYEITEPPTSTYPTRGELESSTAEGGGHDRESTAASLHSMWDFLITIVIFVPVYFVCL